MDIAIIKLAYGAIWWSLSSRLRFLDDCAVGDSWATDGMMGGSISEDSY
jgi:hypothetical protein